MQMNTTEIGRAKLLLLNVYGLLTSNTSPTLELVRNTDSWGEKKKEKKKEIQILRPYPRPAESESAFLTRPPADL